MIDFETSYEKVKKLVEDFKAGEKHYLSQSFNEQEARKYFIDKFFIALGWDVNHDQQNDPSKHEVKIEKTQSNQKRTDYTFFLNPNFKDPKFFVEAKKPSQNLKNADYYFQTIRYGWNANTRVAVLTDFEEFHILDCRSQPNISYVLNNPNHKQYHYSQYADKEKFTEIYYLFSREAVLDNSLERYSEALPKPKGKAFQKGLFKGGYQPVDESFLEYLDEVRTSLAKAFKRNDESLTSEQLTEATQRTIDRLVFIRFLEDKLIEQENYVSEFGNSGSSWSDFLSACKKLNAKYNGIVFKKHFIDEQNFAGPELNEFRTICNDICHLNSPYDFNVIPIHILGSIYERFLGKVVHATAKRVTVEEKQEVRKAGGVYYTPKYIVDYIVQNTIGKLIEGKTPEQIAKLRFADIACGSGSFLIGVFDCLLLYHNTYYFKNPAKAKKDGCYFKDGLWVLSIQQKQKILLNNIYGVDIDQQATEVTQLSLALKMLEDETTATANDMMVLFHEKILPDMAKKNIICGNSLISDNQLIRDLFAKEDKLKLNSMDFETVFAEVFKPTIVKKTLNLPDNISGDDDIVKEPIVGYEQIIKGGFDAIIGNPPYVNNKELPEDQKKYFANKYKTAVDQFDLYTLFIENGITLLKDGGLFSYIIPDAIIDRSSASSLRKFIYSNSKIISLLQINNVFKDANVGSAVLILQKQKNATGKFNYLKCANPEEFNSKNIRAKIISQKNLPNFRNYSFLFVEDNEWDIIKKIFKDKIKLESISFMGRGEELGKSSEITKAFKDKNNIGLLYGEDVQRYEVKEPKRFIPEAEIKKQDKLYDVKLVVRQVGNEINASLDDKKFVTIQSVYTIIPNESFDNKFILGILNSKMIDFIYKKLYKSKELFPRILLESLKELPIKNISSKSDKAAHDKIVSLVGDILETKKEIKSAKTDKDITYYQRTCQTLDAQIDAEVYKLYDLTADEIAIIENNK